MKPYTSEEYLSELEELEQQQVIPSILNDLRELIYSIETRSALISVKIEANDSENIWLHDIAAGIHKSTQNMRAILSAFDKYNKNE